MSSEHPINHFSKRNNFLNDPFSLFKAQVKAHSAKGPERGSPTQQPDSSQGVTSATTFRLGVCFHNLIFWQADVSLHCSSNTPCVKLMDVSAF